MCIYVPLVFGLEGQEGWKSAANILHGFDCSTTCSTIVVVVSIIVRKSQLLLLINVFVKTRCCL